ncbi:RecX family transcriptional regulator [Cellulomonas sp. ES6]|uniref:RecX family transcriptional regulator n=1 Tax=Cellulomonas sp. ES6 TaxID=3039384 RepID=UPI0032D57CED
MSAEHDQVARPAGRTPSGRSGAWDVPGEAGGSAWDDLSASDTSAWDDEVAAVDGRSAVTGAAAPDAFGRHDETSVWDDDRPVPSAWAEVGTPGSTALATPGRAAQPRASQGTPAGPVAAGAHGDADSADVEPADVGACADGEPADVGELAGVGGPVGPDSAPHPARARDRSEVAATTAELAARMAEILARPAGDDPASTAGASARGGGTRASARGAGAVGSQGTGGVPPTAEDAEPAGGDTRRRDGAGGRRPTRGRRRAPASEPPQDGPAATDAEPDPESVARSLALRLLTGAPRSRAQLAEAMARKDVPEEVAERVLDRFTDVGLVDDGAYAEMLVRTRHAERGMSRRGIAQELRRRGVDDVTARDALAQVDDEDEERAARALARKKLSATRGLDRETRLRRAYGALGRKGYGGELVARVVREELAAEGADLDD